jgi:hypothetical protein
MRVVFFILCSLAVSSALADDSWAIGNWSRFTLRMFKQSSATMSMESTRTALRGLLPGASSHLPRPMDARLRKRPKNKPPPTAL